MAHANMSVEISSSDDTTRQFDADMAACYGRDLQKKSDYVCNRHFTANTKDHQDHSFNGVMFDLVMKESGLPLEFLEIQSLAVRGYLGPVSIWITPDTFRGKEEDYRRWFCVYRGNHNPSMRTYKELQLDKSVTLYPGESCGVYVHSALQNDRGIVYDNRRGEQGSDDILNITTGIAHTSSTPFSPVGYWGGGWAWRDRRQFVGQIKYGVKFLLWQPSESIHCQFPAPFKRAVDVMLVNISGYYFSDLPEHVVWYIINMMPYDWVCADGDHNKTYASGASAAFVLAKRIRKRITCRSRSCTIS